MSPRCDVKDCTLTPTMICICRRCSREQDYEERFLSCHTHGVEVSALHEQIRQRPVEWTAFGELARIP